MNKKLLTLIIILIILIITLITMGIFSFFKKQNIVSDKGSSWKNITLPVRARGDYVPPGPIEKECQRRMEAYMKSDEFKAKGFSKCELVESEVGITAEKCPGLGGVPMAGCSICKIRCK